MWPFKRQETDKNEKRIAPTFTHSNYIHNHVWWCGSERNAIPWDGIAAVRWCKYCGVTEIHYGRIGKGDWWEAVN